MSYSMEQVLYVLRIIKEMLLCLKCQHVPGLHFFFFTSFSSVSLSFFFFPVKISNGEKNNKISYHLISSHLAQTL